MEFGIKIILKFEIFNAEINMVLRVKDDGANILEEKENRRNGEFCVEEIDFF